MSRGVASSRSYERARRSSGAGRFGVAPIRWHSDNRKALLASPSAYSSGSP